MSGDLKPGVRGDADASVSKPASGVEAFHAGIAAWPRPAPAEDLRVPGKPPDISALLPWIDDHDPPTATAPRRTPPPAASASKPVATTAAASTAQPPDLAETLATAKAAAFNLELEVLRLSGDPKAKYKVQDVLERADDSLTRTKMKKQYAAANDGKTFDSMITSAKGLDERDKQHALGLMSDRRDATTDKLAAMDPNARAKLEDDAAVWADKLLHITRADDRDDSDHADQIANILGSRSPEELEVIRSRVRLQTSGTERTTTFEELDRTFSGRDKDIVLAGLTGSPTHLASTRLVDAAVEGDPARIHRIVKELKPEKLAELRTMNPMLLAQVASNMPAEHRAEIEAALGGRVAEAEGARIATLFQPVDLTVADTRDAAKVKRLLNRKEAQAPERMIEELGKMSAAELDAARDAWDKANPGKSWDALIGERYKDADSTVRLRIDAAARGDKIGERALRLRQGMRTFDQHLIDGALYNPDLKSENPDKRSAAEAERRELEARMQRYDAGDQRTKAMLEGKATPDAVVGRSTDEQLDAHYKKAELHDSAATGNFMDKAKHAVTKDERMAKVREKANVDRYAAKEMSREGEAHASTKVRRAELSGNTLQKAEILERLDSEKTEGSNNTLEAQGAEYRMKFGARDMLAAPKLSNLTDAAEAVAMLTGDERAPGEIAAELSRDNMDVGELRVEHLRETGVLADRTRGQRLEQQKEIRDLTESGWLEGSEQMRFLRGGNRGSEDLLDSSINLMERGNAEGVDDREQRRRDRSTTQAVELQRDEKQREAAKVTQVISIAAKIAAIATANPALFVAVDAGFGLLRVAANELIANEANDMTADFQHLAVDVGVNLLTAGGGRFGKGLQAGTQAAKGAQMAQRVGNVGAAVGGAAAHSAIDGQDGGGAVVRAAFGALLPGYFRGKAENAIQGTGKVASAARAVTGTAVDLGSNFGISGHVDGGGVIDALTNTVQGRGHGSAHGAKRKPTTEDFDAPAHDRVTQRMSAVDVAAHERVTQPMQALEPQVHERVTQPMQAVEPPAHQSVAKPMQAVEPLGHELSTAREPVREPASLQERIDQTSGVDKGPGHEQWRRDMAAMYANQELEAQNVTTVQKQPHEARKDGTHFVGNTNYDVRRFQYDNATLTSITLDAHLRPGSGITPAQIEAVKQSTFRGVDEIANRGADGKRHTLPDGSKLQVEPFFHDDASNADHVADVVPPGVNADGSRIGSNQGRWVLPEVLNPVGAAHELVGHGLGLPDTYWDPTTWFRDTPNSPHVTHDGSFMESVAPGSTMKQRHLDQLSRDISASDQSGANAGPAMTSHPLHTSHDALAPAVHERTRPEQGGPESEGIMRKVSSDGLRNEDPLTPKQVNEVVDYAKELGVPEEVINVSENVNTSWGDIFGAERLYIGTDVLPSTNPRIAAESANSRVSGKGAIAHEVVGHRAAARAGQTQDAPVLEEAQASIRAARFAPGLSAIERLTLIRDAVERIQKAGLRVADVRDGLWIEEP